jgi:hypothetical protein|tara:strand:+ start:463 stop:840 length:378 start_codon:yes stop_codon:yes gene_type:complete
MVITEYDSAGNITGITINPEPEELEGINYVEGRFNASDYYIQNGVPVEAEDCGAVWDKETLVADGVDTAVLSGLPSPCLLIVGRKRNPITVTGGVYNFTATNAGAWRIQLGDVHLRPHEWFIQAT